jgi:RoxA-like, cytochrome c-like
MRQVFVGVVVLSIGQVAAGAERDQGMESSAERGRKALFGTCFSPPIISRRQYDRLWKVWGLKEKPADFDRLVRERYGLHPAPYANDDLPMGLRKATSLFGEGIGTDCLQCHAASVFGKPVVGLGNASLDLQALFDDFAALQGMKELAPMPFSHVRGTTEASASAAYLFQFRNPDLSVRLPVKMDFPTSSCEDTPAWWLLKKKKTMYHTGSHATRAVRPLMSFLLSPLNSGTYIKSQESIFRDIRAYLLSLEAPRYPFPIDTKKAAAGRIVFEQTCSRCHGTYGPEGSYPNKVIPLETIGTDPSLATGYDKKAQDDFNASWFGQEKDDQGKLLRATLHRGYQAPPLDGVWATAPYFHNGSVPTVYHVLNSKARPKVFTRSYRTGKEDYDSHHLGWKITVLEKGPGTEVPAIERRKVYDTTQRGRSNGGHPFGDRLTEKERLAVIEYLKTL